MASVAGPAPPSPIADALVSLVDRAPAAPGLDDRSRAVLARIVASPLSYALAAPPSPRVRQPLRAMLEAMRLAGPAVASFLRGLADAFDLDMLAEVEGAGWIQSWPTDGMVAVSLTPRAAEHVGVELVERGLDGDESHWRPVDPRPRPIRSRPQYGTRRGPGWLEACVDPAPGPLERAIEREEYLEQERRTAAGEPIRDEQTGAIARERIRIMGVEVPRARRRTKVSKKKRRKAAAPA
jgi:hypothetical protein